MGWIQIKAPHFTAGLELKGNTITGAAPIIKYMVGWSYFSVRRYCNKKGWEVYVGKITLK